MKQVNIDDKFEFFVDYISIDRCREIIDHEIGKIVTFKTNSFGDHKDKVDLYDPYMMKKQRSMYCSQVSKLVTAMVGPECDLLRGRIIFSDELYVTHTINKMNGLLYDFTMSQVESVGIKEIDYNKFKSLGQNFIDGFFHIRYKKIRSQDLDYRFPTVKVRKVCQELADKYEELYYLKYYDEMIEEMKQHA